MDGTFRLRGIYDDHYTNNFQGCTKDNVSVVVSMVHFLAYYNCEYWEEIGQLLQLFLYFFYFLHSLQYHTHLGGRMSFAQLK